MSTAYETLVFDKLPMSSVVVYVILLDNLPGFSNVLNETVITNTRKTYSNFTPIIGLCNPEMTVKILDAVSRAGVEVVPTFKRRNKYPITSLNDIFSEKSKENIYNALLGTPLPELDYKEEFFKNPTNKNNESDQVYRRTYSLTNRYKIINITNGDKNIKEELDYPKSAPFLVAIFETLSNITAQTCAGTLISPRWVLTAANCFNILSNLYANNTNVTAYKSVYTVVAGAVDPLSDGSTHNVTTVLQYQENSTNFSRTYKSVHVEIGPYLAMMKIEPGFKGAGLPMVEEKVKKGDVMIYGWILVKNESGVDALRLTRMSALILSSAECQAMYNYNDNDVICLFNSAVEKNSTQLSSGGPVLLLHGGEARMLAVVQTDGDVFIAYPLYVHYNWINKILNMK